MENVDSLKIVNGRKYQQFEAFFKDLFTLALLVLEVQ